MFGTPFVRSLPRHVFKGKPLFRSIRFFSGATPSENSLPNLPPPQKIADDDARRKCLAWRAKQRGWLELDWLLGSFANQHLANLTTEAELKEFEEILELDNPDLYLWLSGQKEAPEEIGEKQVYKLIASYVQKDHPQIAKKMWKDNQNLS